MKTTALLALALGALAACAQTKSLQIYAAATVDGPREIALSGIRQPWTGEIESRLRQKGYSVKRFVSTSRTTELVSPDRIESYNSASARIILNLDGYAPNSSALRCIGGGYKFDYITAEVIDVRNNETLASYSNSGYSESCPPLSQPIFADIVGMVDAIFKVSPDTSPR